ncbi:MAG: hypothetical protein LBK54_00015 [Propionibacteriaceae bacterium]|jgi:hypothetical protein|nr:hypothetical protein [Propionibacteriaceae bacterium]
MSHRDDALRDLDGARILDAMRWAARSAAARTLADFSEAAGHDARWLGLTRHILLEDRLDRVFSLGRYYVPEGADAATGMDVVVAELTQEDIASMPVIPPGTVKRANIQGSPGWTTGKHHFLIQSFQPGEVDEIRWERKSETKQEVARQPNPDAPALLEIPPAMRPVPIINVALDAPVLVLAHSLNPINGSSELYLGLPSITLEHDGSWHWRHALHDQRPSGPGAQIPTPNHPASPNDVPDAPVRLRDQKPGRESLEEERA